jgi:hypothetical protein
MTEHTSENQMKTDATEHTNNSTDIAEGKIVILLFFTYFKLNLK